MSIADLFAARLATMRESIAMQTYGHGVKIEPRAVWELERDAEVQFLQYTGGNEVSLGRAAHPRACSCCGAPWEPRCSYCQRTDYNHQEPVSMLEASKRIYQMTGVTI